MNKHTLNYHTRLHDWYRQHSIQQEKHEVSTHPQHHQHQQQRQIHPVSDPAGTGQLVAADANLTQDKLYAINDWCANVNRNLFRVKKREAPPLFRRCRVTSASTVTSAGSNRTGRQLRFQGEKRGAKNDDKGKFTADPRRVRSAEVFTVSGHWSKQPKVRLGGGELLGCATRPDTASRLSSLNAVRDLDLCVRNSKDKDETNGTAEQTRSTLPRVNHDSLTLRPNALILKQNGPRLAQRVGSPRDSVGIDDPNKKSTMAGVSLQRAVAYNRDTLKSKLPTTNEDNTEVKVAAPNCKTGMGNEAPRLKFMGESGDISEIHFLANSPCKEVNKRDKVQEKNIANEKRCLVRPATCKPRNEVIKDDSSEDCSEAAEDKLRTKSLKKSEVMGGDDIDFEVDDASEGEESRETGLLRYVRPGFCNNCSGIYSTSPILGGDRPISSTSPACGHCVHGIQMDTSEQQQSNNNHNYHIIKSKNVSEDDKLDKALKRTVVEVSRVECRLLENGLHYNAERANVRDTFSGCGDGHGGSRANTVTGIRARLAAQMAVDEEEEEGDTEEAANDWPDDQRVQTDEKSLNSPEEYTCCHDSVKNETLTEGVSDKKAKRKAHITIVTKDLDQNIVLNSSNNYVHSSVDSKTNSPRTNDSNKENVKKDNNISSDSNDDYDDDECDDDADLLQPPEMLDRENRHNRNLGRRMSINFTYKPVVAAPSVSNGLLNVISIDDCKFHMRYSPHKVLEEHEVTDNIMVPLSLLQLNNGISHNDIDDDNNANDNKAGTGNGVDSKAAMRISRGSTPEEFIRSSRYRKERLIGRGGVSHSAEAGMQNYRKGDGASSPENTLIPSSIVLHATEANVRRFRALHDANDSLNVKTDLRPRSACLARAFHTLINDRSVMQHFDKQTSRQSSKNKVFAASKPKDATGPGSRRERVNVGKQGAAAATDKTKSLVTRGDNAVPTIEPTGGPKYRLINAALRRHMGQLMQEQCKKLQVRYQRQRSAASGMKIKGLQTSPSHTPSLSLSLESLPSVKRGILRDTAPPPSCRSLDYE